MPFKDPGAGSGFYVDEGRYQATLTELREELSKISFDGKGPQMQVIWSFELRDDEGLLTDDRGGPLQFWVYTSTSLHEKSKARPIAEALLNRSIEELTGEQVQSAVVGKSCSVLVADEARPDGSVRSVPMNWAPLKPAVSRTAGRRGQPASPPDDAERLRQSEEDLANIPF